MKREESVVDILMDDDEIEVLDEVARERIVDAVGDKDRISAIPYRSAIIEVGPDIKLRVLDIAILIVAIILAYMIYTEVF